MKPEDALLRRLEDLIGPHRVEKTPVLLDGPPSTGKTHSAREFGLRAGFSSVQEVAGHSGVEPIDLLGSFLPNGEGGFVWTDGPVTAAYRAAAEGRKSLLIIDEVYRIPLRHRSVLLNALIPHRFEDGKEYFLLRVGRPKPGSLSPDGVAKTEFIAAPVSNISIVGTTNSGSAYPDVEMDDPALKQRWHMVHVQMNEDAQRKIFESRCTALKLPQKFAQAVFELAKSTRKLREDSMLDDELSPRLALRVLNLIPEATKEGFEKAAQEMIPTLVGRTPYGNVNEDQQTNFMTAVAATVTKLKL